MYVNTSKLATVTLVTILSANSVLGAPIAGRSSNLLTRDPRGSHGSTSHKVSSVTGAISDGTGAVADALTLQEYLNQNQKRSPRGHHHPGSGSSTGERVSTWTGALGDIIGMGADAATIAEAANNQKRDPRGHHHSSCGSSTA